jgi:hypothetical protein
LNLSTPPSFADRERQLAKLSKVMNANEYVLPITKKAYENGIKRIQKQTSSAVSIVKYLKKYNSVAVLDRFVYHAAENMRSDVIALLANEANVNLNSKQQDWNGQPICPLGVACGEEDCLDLAILVVNTLIALGCNMEQTFTYTDIDSLDEVITQTPLQIALEHRNWEIALILIRSGANVLYPIPVIPVVDMMEYTPLLTVVCRPRVCSDNHNLLLVASELIERGVDVNEISGINNLTALDHAAASLNHDLVKLLIDKGNAVVVSEGMPRNNGCIHFIQTCRQRDYYTHQPRSRYTYDQGQKIIARAKETVRVLLDRGAHINMLHGWCSGQGDTALHAAYKTNNFEIAKLLIYRGIDINIKNSNGQTAREFLESDAERFELFKRVNWDRKKNFLKFLKIHRLTAHMVSDDLGFRHSRKTMVLFQTLAIEGIHRNIASFL